MSATAVETNGHAGTRQPTAESDTDSTPTPDQPGREAKVQLLVERDTRNAVNEAAGRLGRSQDQVVAAGIVLLNERTKDQKAKSKQEWLREIAGGQS